NAESRDRLRRLADGQVSLRRVATLVAEGTSATDLFAVVAEEIAQMLGLTAISIDRYDGDRTSTVVAARTAPAFRVGSPWTLGGPSLSAAVLESGRPARIEDYSELSGSVASAARDSGIAAAAGVPILVDGGVWGMIWAGTTKDEPLPEPAEA